MHAAMPDSPSHSFVVPAFGRSPFLRDCLESLRAQTDPSPIVITSSTPHDGLHALAREFGALIVEHSPNRGIGRDWNFALSQATTTWVTIAHQDDLYAPRFKELTLAAITAAGDDLMVFTDYEEVAEGARLHSYLPGIKRALLEIGFLGRNRIVSRRSRTNCLRFGNAIPCPTVTLNRTLAQTRFNEHMRVNLDWEAWLDLCDVEGGFVRVRKPLVAHRIHAESETSNTLSSGHRVAEDEQILSRLWPRWMARAIARTYALAYASNAS